MAEDRESSDYYQGSSSDLSLPTYSLRENRKGELISLTREKVHWPLRPPTGKYSTLEGKKNCRRQCQQAELSVSSDVIDPAVQEKSIFSAFLRSSDSDRVPRRSSSFLHTDLTETVSSRILIPKKKEEETYAILGQEPRAAVLEKLNDRMTTILFEDRNKKLQLALCYEQIKFIMRVVEMRNETTTYGLASRDDLPEVSFFSLAKLVKFYSVHPLAAFIHL